ncbi:hypothetical protein CKA32_003149 [Geitlerinema sp. FC II]|nr:hypothetical protein CKA32_003149 [Geitlerinema sp. FC II]
MVKLTRAIENSDLEHISLSLYKFGSILIASGKSREAYDILSYLIQGKFKLSSSSALRLNLKNLVFPSLCYALEIDCPSFDDRASLNQQDLTKWVREIEQQSRKMSLFDRSGYSRLERTSVFLNSIFEGFFDRSLSNANPKKIQKILNSPNQRFWKFEIRQILKKLYIDIQVWCGQQKFDRAIQSIETYKTIYEAYNRSNYYDDRLENVQIIAIDTYFQLGENTKAIEWLLFWWSSSENISDSKLLDLIGYRNVIKTLVSGIFQNHVDLSDCQISTFFEIVKSCSVTKAQVTSYFVPSVSDWRHLTQVWHESLFYEFSQEDYYLFCSVDFNRIQQIHRNQQGATEEDIQKLERRLKKSLPLSYRNFLLCCNGWFVPAYFSMKFLDTEKINWFDNLNPEWIKIWTNFSDREIDEEIDNEEYFQYGKSQSCCQFRSQYLKTALQISTDCDGYVYLLNPEVIDERGEWEAWEFGDKYPGAYRYRSFWEMMQAIYKRAEAEIDSYYSGI